MKKLYGVGVGPGDAELITLKGYNLIKKADVIFIPMSRGESTAGSIAKEYIDGKRVLKLEFTMGEDNKKRYVEAADIINTELKDGETGVFLTIGDPMVYSTFVYLVKELFNNNIEVESIPGITSFGAAANRTMLPISLKDDKFYLCDGKIDEEIIKKSDSICILKTYKNKTEILDILERNNFKYVYVKRCGYVEEKIIYEKEEILNEKDYMSLILGRRVSNG